ncbi:MAG: sulfite exporter TauE/SafE family protein [Deltaproteobacteria bacterium]|nr:sulfite exporter TauE/SafE family protein [Deltaproteobacteria bacterium]
MWNLVIAGALILIVAVSMTMVGKGGGNFYVVILALSGVPMYQAAATSQFILFTASLASMFVFHRNKAVSWPLAFIIGGSTALAALTGGFFSHLFSGFALKLIFAALLIVAGGVMLLPVAGGGKKAREKTKTFGVLTVKLDGLRVRVNLWIALPVTLLTGFAVGMVGASGGSFLVPLMVLVCCTVPMHVAVGTASSLIAATAFMGFLGHAARGDFHPGIAVPLAVVTIVGGVIGGHFALKTKPKSLKRLFAYTNWLAALLMVYNALRLQDLL